MTQEVKSDNAIYSMLFGDRVAKDFKIFNFDLIEAKGLEGYFRDKMGG